MISQLIDLGPYQWVGLLFGIGYIILAIREYPLCWFFGIISCAAIAIEDFTATRLYQDGVLQIFYIIVSFYGIYKWKKHTDTQDDIQVQYLPIHRSIGYIVIGALFATALSFGIAYYTDAAHPFLDAMTSVFSVIATYLLVHKYIETWVLWIIIDVFYVYLYFDTSAPLFSLLYLIFTGMAVLGLVQWSSKFKKKTL